MGWNSEFTFPTPLYFMKEVNNIRRMKYLCISHDTKNKLNVSEATQI